MATPFLDRIQAELASIDAAYQAGFAGQSRATRDLGALDSLIADVDAVLTRIDQIPAVARGRELTEEHTSATGLRAMLREERGHIERARRASPTQESFGVAAAKANFAFATYRRHFANQSRASRDVALLAELIGGLESIAAEMGTLRSRAPEATFDRDLEVVRANLRMYRDERAAIEKDQAGGTPEERANLLGGLANAQFQIYGAQFAGKSRASRRPALLERVIASLASIERRMRDLTAAGFREDWHTKNVDIVVERQRTYQDELALIRDARKGTPAADLMSVLGDAANQLFAEYAEHFGGKARTTVDETRLSTICDGLSDLATQMEELDRVSTNRTNLQNLDIVRQNLLSYETEWEHITKAKGALS